MSTVVENGWMPGACDSPTAASYVDGHCRCMVCSHCGHHTGNAHQGHYWAYCAAAGTMREYHFCCPGNCELEARPARRNRRTWRNGQRVLRRMTVADRKVRAGKRARRRVTP